MVCKSHYTLPSKREFGPPVNILTKIHYSWPPILDPIYSKRPSISDLLTKLVCDICYNARKINSFTRKGQFIKSGNFSISQGKLNSFKEVRGRSRISAYCRSYKHTPSAGYILFLEIKRQADIGFPIRSIHSVLYIHDKFM